MATELKYGPYRSPLVSRVGTILPCELRGPVKVVGITKSPIPWPIAENDGHRALVVYRGLARALRVETGEAIARARGSQNCARLAMLIPGRVSPPSSMVAPKKDAGSWDDRNEGSSLQH